MTSGRFEFSAPAKTHPGPFAKLTPVIFAGPFRETHPGPFAKLTPVLFAKLTPVLFAKLTPVLFAKLTPVIFSGCIFGRRARRT